MDERLNWSGNYAYGATELHRPVDVDELRTLVAGSTKVRPLGSRHSFNALADSPGDQVSLDAMAPFVQIDEASATARVGAWMRYGEVAEALDAAGYALANLASLPHISVAGASATGTHGSGVRNGGLSTSVVALELVDGRGEVVRLDREHPDFTGAVVNLGALGVVTAMTLALVPSFQVRQFVYRDVPRDLITTRFDEIMSSAYSVSCFTRWQEDTIDHVWRKCVHGEPADVDGLVPSDVAVHPIPGVSGQECTEQFGRPGPWHQRLPHFRLEFTPSNGNEIQSEYFVPREHAVDAIGALFELGKQIDPLLQVGEIRTIAADDQLLSPTRGADVVAFHFTWVQQQDAVERLLPSIESALDLFDVVPHWGKVSTMDPGLVAKRFARIDEFAALTRRYDPQGTFRNDVLDAYLA